MSSYVICIILSMFLTDVLGENAYVINAVLLGRKGDTLVEYYEKVEEAVLDSHPGDYFCHVDFIPLEYDTKNGTTMYRSLEKARKSFLRNDRTIAIGPFIDVFTSMDYVIKKQIHLITSSSENVEPNKNALPILPDSKSLSEAIAEVVQKLQWRKVAFLSQDDFSPVLALSNRNIFAWPIRLPADIKSNNDPELKLTMTQLREAQMHNFILHSMDKNVVEHVMKAAEELHLLHYTLNWFVTYLDFEDLVKDLKKTVSLYGFQLLDVEKIPSQLITDELFSKWSRLQIALLVDVVSLLHHSLQGVYNLPCNTQPDRNQTMFAERLVKIMKDKNDPYIGALGQYIWEKTSGSKGRHRTSYSMSVLQHNANVSEKRSNMVGNCTFNGSPSYTSLVGPVETKVGDIDSILLGNNFSVITKEDPPFVIKNGDRYEGFCIDVLEELKEIMRFEYHIIPFESKWAGQEDREWDDIIHRLLNGEASMAVGALVVKAKREEIISFSYTLLSNAVSILVKEPPEQLTFFQFLSPFSIELWIMILVFLFVVGFSLYLMTKYDSTQLTAEQKFDFKESMWYSINVLLQGGTEFSPQTTSMRTIVAFFWFCTLIITAAYTANLAAYLTLRQVDSRIKTIQALAAQSEIDYGVMNNSDLMTLFEEAQKDPYERMWAFMKLNDSFVSNREEGVAKVLAGTQDKAFVFLDDGLFNEYYAKKYCGMASTNQGFGFKHYSIGFPKGAPFKDDINRAILHLKEQGTLDMLKDKWWKTGVNCSSSVDDESGSTPAGSLDLVDMVGVFIVLGVCVILGIVVEIGKQIRLAVERRRSESGPELQPEPKMRQVIIDDIFMKNPVEQPTVA